MNRRGVTFVELLIVFAVVGILARLMLPRMQQLRAKAVATRVVSDYHAIKLAAYSYYTVHRAWPAEAGAGMRPPELARDLGNSVSFSQSDYVLDWEHWSVPGGLPSSPATTEVVGVTVTTSDPAVGQNVLRLLGPHTIHFTAGNATTYLIVGNP
ncbi:MAG TPA: type II secretion system protein [Gemmatimonadales bacterium]|nr:type II secretion system protein [Gemmatimonadales bacterium]